MDQIGKEYCSALDVKKHNFGCDEVAEHQDLIDLACPIGIWRMSEVIAKLNIFALLSQSWRAYTLAPG